MPRIADPMVDIFKDSEEVTLRHPLFEQGFDRFEVLRERLRGETFEMRRTLLINGRWCTKVVDRDRRGSVVNRGNEETLWRLWKYGVLGVEAVRL